MSTQPEALRLAELLEFESEVAESCGGQGAETTKVKAESAAQLRAQHELIQTLKAALEECVEDSEAAIVDHLQKYGHQYKAQRVVAMRKQVADARAALAAAEAHK